MSRQYKARFKFSTHRATFNHFLFIFWTTLQPTLNYIYILEASFYLYLIFLLSHFCNRLCPYLCRPYIRNFIHTSAPWWSCFYEWNCHKTQINDRARRRTMHTEKTLSEWETTTANKFVVNETIRRKPTHMITDDDVEWWSMDKKR